MSTSWREIVLTLADPDSELIEGVARDLEGRNFAQMELPGAYFRIVRDSPDEAMRALAYALADLRLAQSLEAAGWTDINDVIDQCTYVVARDLEGTVWAIGAASQDDDRRAYIEPDMGGTVLPSELLSWSRSTQRPHKHSQPRCRDTGWTRSRTVVGARFDGRW